MTFYNLTLKPSGRLKKTLIPPQQSSIVFVLSLQKLCLHLKPPDDLRFYILQDEKGARDQPSNNVNILNTTRLSIQTQLTALFKKWHTEYSKA